jgi:hypothetical protein
VGKIVADICLLACFDDTLLMATDMSTLPLDVPQLLSGIKEKVNRKYNPAKRTPFACKLMGRYSAPPRGG